MANMKSMIKNVLEIRNVKVRVTRVNSDCNKVSGGIVQRVRVIETSFKYDSKKCQSDSEAIK